MFESSHPDHARRSSANERRRAFLFKPMHYYVYILESGTDGSWYYGYTENLEQRLSDHQTNRSKYTRNKGPWRIIFSKQFATKTEALEFEKYLKKTRNKRYITEKYKGNFLI